MPQSTLLVAALCGSLGFMARASVDCALPIDLQGATCGGSSGYRCDVTQCCSQYGYCGSSSRYCGAGCQSGFGTCSTSDPETCSASPSAPDNGNFGGNLIGQYYATWNPLSDVNWSYTDIAYYFVLEPTSDGQLNNPSGDMETFVQTAHRNGKKALLVLGGWTGSQWFSDLLSEQRRMYRFVRNIKLAVRNNGFDGVDIDWEYPNDIGNGNTYRPEDTANVLLMLRRLRTAIGSGRLISMAVNGAGLKGADGSYLTNYSEFDEILDYLTLMVYDMYGPGTSGPNALLYEFKIRSGVGVVEFFVAGGTTASKLMPGVPSYAYTFQLRSARLSTSTLSSGITSMIYQGIRHVVPQGDCYDVKVCNEATGCGWTGQWTFQTMISCGALSQDGKTGQGGYTRMWDDVSGTPYLFNPRKKTFISYDHKDAQSIELKTKYATQRGLAGIVVFAAGGFNSQVLSAARAGSKVKRLKEML